MRRPWQIWLLFVLCLAIVLPALCWLTVKALELDRAEAEARRQTELARQQEAVARGQAEVARRQADVAREQAEMQELASSALWRMDWTLTPLVAQEAARPYYVYLPFYPVPGEKGGKGAPQFAPSPLLVQPSEFVLLNFQLAPDETLSSPQCPSALQCPAAIAEGTPQENIDASCERLGLLRKSISHEQLVSMLPEQMLPPVEVNTSLFTANMPTYGNRAGQENPITYDLGLKQLAQQLSEQGTRAVPGAGGQGQSDRGQNERGQSDRGPEMQQPGGRGRGRYVDPPGLTSRGGDPDAAPGAPGQSAANPNPNPNVNDDYNAKSRDQMVRGGNEWQRRNRAYESYAQTQIIQQRQVAGNAKPQLQLVSEGVSRPVWVGQNLLLARRVKIQDRVLIQGCWLDWPRLKAMLVEEVADLLPDVELEPVLPHSTVVPGRALATLPVQLVLREPLGLDEPPVAAALDTLAAVPASALSPIRLSLVVAWSCFLLATLAVGALLQGVITLSERRGAFVSAVTHELRTPLTTFRMYAEMLAEGMVPAAEQRQKYLDTLRIEADRLAHLVENVLSYARLERGKPGGRREDLSIGRLLDRVSARLADRSQQAGMKLAIDADECVREAVVSTDPAAVEQILFNLVDNACKYAGAADDRRIHVAFSIAGRRARVEVSDHGPGISVAAARRLFRPFSKSVHEAANSAPGVGLGLALSRRLARALGGSLDIACGQSGARFILTLPLA